MTNSREYRHELAADRFGLRVAAHLTELADDLPHDVCERLRVARLQAVAQHRRSLARQTVQASLVTGASVATLAGPVKPWGRMGIVLPLLALVVGMFAIDVIQSDSRTKELAEIDVAILTDDLPPAAYADPGFAQFLKLNAPRTP